MYQCIDSLLWITSHINPIHLFSDHPITFSLLILQIDLQPYLTSEADPSALKPNHAWEFESFASEHKAQIYDCCPDTYAWVEFILRLRRRPGFFRDLYIIPTIVLASLVPFVFALPVTRIHRYILGKEPFVPNRLKSDGYNWCLLAENSDAKWA